MERQTACLTRLQFIYHMELLVNIVENINRIHFADVLFGGI